MNLVTRYVLNPNNPIIPDRFILSDLTGGGPDNINLNCFIAPLNVLNSIDKINFIIQSSDLGNYKQEYTYPYGEYYEDSIVPILPYGVLFACLANPNNLTLPNIPLGGFDKLYGGIQDIIRINIQLITQDTVKYNCEIYVLPANLEPSKITNIGYATIKEALTILGGSMSGRTQTDFIRKSELINLNADSSKLTKYGNNDFVNVPDIVKVTYDEMTGRISFTLRNGTSPSYYSGQNGSFTMIKNGTKADGLHAFTAESNTNKNVSINAHFRSLVPNTYNKIQIVIGENIFGWYDLPYSSSDFNWLSNCQDLHQFMHNNMNQTFSITIRLKKE